MRVDGNGIVVEMTLEDLDDNGCLIVPAEFEGEQVKGLGEGCLSQLDSKIKSVKFLAHNEPIDFTIEEAVFEGCSIRSVEFPDPSEEKGTTYHIGERAFAHTSIEEIHLPDSVKTIDTGAFERNYNLLSINIPNGMDYIPSDFCAGSIVTNIEIPKGVKKIGSRAFASCKFEELSLPDSITTIGRDAFGGNSWLKDIHLPSNLESIGIDAFSFCGSLEAIDIPDKVEELPNGVFRQCDNLMQVRLPSNLQLIGGSCFCGCSRLKNIDIPKNVRSIGEGRWNGSTFEGCSSLENIVIPDGIDEIPEYTFSGCTSLKKIDMPKELKRIGIGAFKECSSLRELTIPEGVHSLAGVIGGCKKLETMTLPSTLVYHTTSFENLFRDKTKEPWDSSPAHSRPVLNIAENTFSNCNPLLHLKMQDSSLIRNAVDNTRYIHHNLPVHVDYITPSHSLSDSRNAVEEGKSLLSKAKKIIDKVVNHNRGDHDNG